MGKIEAAWELLPRHDRQRGQEFSLVFDPFHSHMGHLWLPTCSETSPSLRRLYTTLTLFSGLLFHNIFRAVSQITASLRKEI